jgi:ankyrin repeat protein
VICKTSDDTNALMHLISHIPKPEDEIIYLDVIDMLLQNGIQINHQNIFGETALHFAARALNICGVKYLISNGANVTLATTLTDSTPMHYALQRHAFHMSITPELISTVEIFHNHKVNCMNLADVTGKTASEMYLSVKSAAMEWATEKNKVKEQLFFLICFLLNCINYFFFFLFSFQ